MFYISSLTKNQCGSSDSLDKQDEKSPLLSGNQVGKEGGIQNGEERDEKRKGQQKKKEKDFQTIRVPGAGGAVRPCTMMIMSVSQLYNYTCIYVYTCVHEM